MRAAGASDKEPATTRVRAPGSSSLPHRAGCSFYDFYHISKLEQGVSEARKLEYLS